MKGIGEMRARVGKGNSYLRPMGRCRCPIRTTVHSNFWPWLKAWFVTPSLLSQVLNIELTVFHCHHTLLLRVAAADIISNN